jgi:transcriptional regulator with XRE-family HTH domain
MKLYKGEQIMDTKIKIDPQSPYAIKNIFSSRLRALMLNKGMSQSELARRLDLATPSTVSKWCSGTNLPRLDTLERISEEFGVAPAYLVIPMKQGIGGSMYVDKVLRFCFMEPDINILISHCKLLNRLINMDYADLLLVQNLCERLNADRGLAANREAQVQTEEYR